jgi:glutamate 5-kinase
MKRIVIKIGTSSLTHENGKLDYRHIEEMVSVVCDLKNMGYEVVLVSSGAIGAGLGKTNLNKKPEESAKKRALAAIGQISLMAIYEEMFQVYNCQVSQVLLTKSALQEKSNYENIANSFLEMFSYGVLPIVNENDVVGSDDKEADDVFGDNDTMSAEVAAFIKADLLVIWSDIDALYDKDPRTNADAKIIPHVTKLNDEIYKMAGGIGTARGSGGMLTKLQAAEIAMNASVKMVITNSARPEDLYKIIAGESIGTLFCSSAI